MAIMANIVQIRNEVSNSNRCWLNSGLRLWGDYTQWLFDPIRVCGDYVCNASVSFQINSLAIGYVKDSMINNMTQCTSSQCN